MSENKRFKERGDEILQYGEVWAVANCPHHAEVIAEALNILIKENEELKKENMDLKEHQRTLESKIVRLKDRVKTFEGHYSKKDIEKRGI